MHISRHIQPSPYGYGLAGKDFSPNADLDVRRTPKPACVRLESCCLPCSGPTTSKIPFDCVASPFPTFLRGHFDSEKEQIFCCIRIRAAVFWIRLSTTILVARHRSTTVPGSPIRNVKQSAYPLKRNSASIRGEYGAVATKCLLNKEVLHGCAFLYAGCRNLEIGGRERATRAQNE